MHAEYPEISEIPNDVVSRTIYLESREKGNSHRFAAMCAHRSGPAFKGLNQNLLQGRWRDMGLDDSRVPEAYLKEAARAGVSTAGKVYIRGLARRWADPEAWVSSADDVRDVAKRHNLTVTGAVNYTPPERDPEPEDQDFRLADDIVQEIMEEKVRENPELARNVETLREEVVEKHGLPRN